MIGVGLVGWGYWGPKLARNISSQSDCRLVAIADHSEAQRALAATTHPGVRITSAASALFNDPHVDAVVVATPAASHFALALAALQADKHVLLEKPFTRTSLEALTLIDESERRRLTLMVDHTYLFSPAVALIRDLLRSGVIGTLHSYESARLNLGLVRSDVSVLWDVASHDLSILDHLLPTAPLALRAEGTAPSTGSVAYDARLTLSYDAGVTACIDASWTTPTKTRRLVITGSDGRIVYDDLSGQPLTVHPSNGAPFCPTLGHEEPLHRVVEHFLSCIAERRTPRSSAASGLRIVQQLEAAEASLANGGAFVSLSDERMPA